MAAPRPGPGEVLVRVTAAGVRHSDAHPRDGVIPPFRLPINPGGPTALSGDDVRLR